MQDTTPTPRTISRPDLIALLAGDTVCTSCRGRGKIVVAKERVARTCPMCRGTGLRPSTATMRPAAGPF